MVDAAALRVSGAAAAAAGLLNFPSGGAPPLPSGYDLDAVLWRLGLRDEAGVAPRSIWRAAAADGHARGTKYRGVRLQSSGGRWAGKPRQPSTRSHVGWNQPYETLM